MRWFRPRLSRGDKVGVAFHDDGISLVSINISGNKPLITSSLFFPYPEKSDIEKLGFVDSVLRLGGIKHKALSLVFPQVCYRMLLIDKPKIPDEEIVSAMRWKVKDLVDLKSDRLLLAMFPNPEPPTNADQLGQIFLVVADEEKIESLEKIIRKAHGSIETIEIAELSQRNIAILLPEEKDGLALINIEPGGGLITFSKNGELYMARRLEVAFSNFKEDNKTEYLQRLSTELQRSIDYFDRHYRSFPLKNIVAIKPYFIAEQDYSAINSNLTIPCRWCRLTEIIDGEILKTDERQSIFLQAIGAALTSRDLDAAA